MAEQEGRKSQSLHPTTRDEIKHVIDSLRAAVVTLSSIADTSIDDDDENKHEDMTLAQDPNYEFPEGFMEELEATHDRELDRPLGGDTQPSDTDEDLQGPRAISSVSQTPEQTLDDLQFTHERAKTIKESNTNIDAPLPFDPERAEQVMEEQEKIHTPTPTTKERQYEPDFFGTFGPDRVVWDRHELRSKYTPLVFDEKEDDTKQTDEFAHGLQPCDPFADLLPRLPPTIIAAIRNPLGKGTRRHQRRQVQHHAELENPAWRAIAEKYSVKFGISPEEWHSPTLVEGRVPAERFQAIKKSRSSQYQIYARRERKSAIFEALPGLVEEVHKARTPGDADEVQKMIDTYCLDTTPFPGFVVFTYIMQYTNTFKYHPDEKVLTKDDHEKDDECDFWRRAMLLAYHYCITEELMKYTDGLKYHPWPGCHDYGLLFGMATEYNNLLIIEKRRKARSVQGPREEWMFTMPSATIQRVFPLSPMAKKFFLYKFFSYTHFWMYQMCSMQVIDSKLPDRIRFVFQRLRLLCFYRHSLLSLPDVTRGVVKLDTDGFRYIPELKDNIHRVAYFATVVADEDALFSGIRSDFYGEENNREAIEFDKDFVEKTVRLAYNKEDPVFYQSRYLLPHQDSASEWEAQRASWVPNLGFYIDRNGTHVTPSFLDRDEEGDDVETKEHTTQEETTMPPPVTRPLKRQRKNKNSKRIRELTTELEGSSNPPKAKIVLPFTTLQKEEKKEEKKQEEKMEEKREEEKKEEKKEEQPTHTPPPTARRDLTPVIPHNPYYTEPMSEEKRKEYEKYTKYYTEEYITEEKKRESEMTPEIKRRPIFDNTYHPRGLALTLIHGQMLKLSSVAAQKSTVFFPLSPKREEGKLITILMFFFTEEHYGDIRAPKEKGTATVSTQMITQMEHRPVMFDLPAVVDRRYPMKRSIDNVATGFLSDPIQWHYGEFQRPWAGTGTSAKMPARILMIQEKLFAESKKGLRPDGCAVFTFLEEQSFTAFPLQRWLKSSPDRPVFIVALFEGLISSRRISLTLTKETTLKRRL